MRLNLETESSEILNEVNQKKHLIKVIFYFIFKILEFQRYLVKNDHIYSRKTTIAYLNQK